MEDLTGRLASVFLSYAEDGGGIWADLEERARALYGTIGYAEKLAAYIRIAVYESMPAEAKGGIWEDILDVALLAVDYEQLARHLVTAWELEEMAARKDLDNG